jgi:hypothetical protein
VRFTCAAGFSRRFGFGRRAGKLASMSGLTKYADIRMVAASF